MLLCTRVDDRDPRVVRAKLNYFLEGVVHSNRLLMEAQHIPPLYESGVRYRVDPDSAKYQIVLLCDEVLEQREADCKSLAAYLLAERRHAARSEEEAMAFEFFIDWKDYDHDPLGVNLKPSGGVCRIFHVVVQHPDGTREDPSSWLERA